MAHFWVEFLPDEKIRLMAEGHLSGFHPSGTIPIPIEDIIDQLKIDVVPVEDLDIDGHIAYTAKDQKTFYIDKGVMTHQNTNRYHFTLAHELAHILLHKRVFDAADYSDIDGWMEFLDSMPAEIRKRIEIQADKFAGFFLVPTTDFLREYTLVGEQLQAHGVDIQTLPPHSLRVVAKIIGDKFGVSPRVIHHRAVHEGLWSAGDLPPD